MKWPGEDSKRERGETFGPLRGPKDGLYSGFGLVCAIFFYLFTKLNTVVQDITPHECIFYPLTKFKFKFRHFLSCSATVFLFGHAVDCTDAAPPLRCTSEKKRRIIVLGTHRENEGQDMSVEIEKTGKTVMAMAF